MAIATIEQRLEAMAVAVMGRWVTWTDEMGAYMELEESFPFDAAEANAEIAGHIHSDLEEIRSTGVTGANLELGLTHLISCYKIRTWKFPDGIRRTEKLDRNIARIQQKQLEEMRQIVLLMDNMLNISNLDHLLDFLKQLPGVPGDVEQHFGKTLVH